MGVQQFWSEGSFSTCWVGAVRVLLLVALSREAAVAPGHRSEISRSPSARRPPHFLQQSMHPDGPQRCTGAAASLAECNRAWVSCLTPTESTLLSTLLAVPPPRGWTTPALVLRSASLRAKLRSIAKLSGAHRDICMRYTTLSIFLKITGFIFQTFLSKLIWKFFSINNIIVSQPFPLFSTLQ